MTGLFISVEGIDGVGKSTQIGMLAEFLAEQGREVVRTREMPRRYWVAQKGVFSKARIEEFVGFIQARGGAFRAFRFWDPSDFSTAQTSPTGTPSSTDQLLGYGDGTKTEFDLVRVYASTSGDHPQRRAVESFPQLQTELSDTEDKIAAARRYYNNVVQRYNTKQQSFPASVIAGSLGFGPREFYRIEDDAERDPVKVELGA